MNRQLVLVHGRSQQGKNAAELKQEWLDALEEGLQKSGKTLPIDESDVRFPFYGDTLVDLIEGMPINEAAEIVVMGDDVDAEERVFMLQVMEEVRQEAGLTEVELRAAAGNEVVEMGPQNWRWVGAVARALDGRGLSGTGVALATHDVYCYMVNRSIKDEIDEGVAEALKPRVETVVVGHSLGSVVTHAVLRERGQDEGWAVPQFVTVGSPLAVTRIMQSIMPPRWPKCVERWYNARDEDDIVALYPLTPERFNVGEANHVTNDTVVNRTSNQHGISGYLSDEKIAEVIFDALTGE
jgi:hypothetical protein